MSNKPSTSRTTSAKSVLPGRKFSNPDPRILRSLVLDYLAHNSYSNTARVFARDSSVRQLDADGDEIMHGHSELTDDSSRLTDDALQDMDRRREIKIHLLSGRIDDATAALNIHFPSVLSLSSDELAVEATSPSRCFIARTVDPGHLALNLRIQAFIEACRTVPLEYNPSTDSASSLSPSSHSKVRSLSSCDHPDDKQRDLLQRARKLYAQANALDKPTDRARFLEELNHVSGLLAYTVPESSPMVKYLSQERREAVADQINSAILYRTGRGSVSNVELYARYTTVLWSFIQDIHIPPTSANKPPGIGTPPQLSLADSSAPKMRMTGVRNPERPQPTLGFDLRQFLDSST